MILLALLLVLIAVPIAELVVVVKVEQAIGLLPTVALLVADAAVGAAIMRAQGRAAWRRFTEALGTGRVPAREVLDGALVIFGGALLIAPGFLTDVIGAMLLLPPGRALIRRALARRVGSRLVRSLGGLGARRRRSGNPAGAPYDIEGAAVEVHPSDLTR